MKKKIYFDMDGTVYDLYNVENWLSRIRDNDVTAYSDGAPIVDLIELKKVCTELINKGYEIGVITWLAKNSNKRFSRNTALTKKLWVNINMPYVSTITIQDYGTPKQNAIENDVTDAILIDDNDNVLQMWNNENRVSIKADKNLIAKLKQLIN